MDELHHMSIERDRLAHQLSTQTQQPSISSKVSNDASGVGGGGDRNSDGHAIERARLFKLEQELSESRAREKRLLAELDVSKTAELKARTSASHQQNAVGSKQQQHQVPVERSSALASGYNDGYNDPVAMSTADVKTWLERYVFSGTGRIPSVCLDLDGRALAYLASASSPGSGVGNVSSSNPWEYLKYIQQSFGMSPPIALRFAYELNLLFPATLTSSSNSGGVNGHNVDDGGGGVNLAQAPDSPLKRYGFPTASRGRSKSKDKEDVRGSSLPRQPPPYAPPTNTGAVSGGGGVSDNEFLKKDLELKNSKSEGVSTAASPVKVPTSPSRAKTSSPSRMLFRLVDR
jgi:hypothetical protein